MDPDEQHEHTPYYILCRPTAMADGCIYEHNKVVKETKRFLVIHCGTRFLAEYQLGRIHSLYTWPVDMGIYRSEAEALAAAEDWQKLNYPQDFPASEPLSG